MNQKAANSFGALGYLSIVCQWLWMTVSLIGPILSYGWLISFLLPDQSEDAEPLALTIPEPVAMLFVGFAIVFSIGLSLYAIYALPKSVGSSGRKVTNRGADIVLPHVIHRNKARKVSKKRKKALHERITWSIKLGLIAVPLTALIIPVSPRLGLEQEVVIGFGILCAAASLIWFGLQFTLAKVARIPSENIW